MKATLVRGALALAAWFVPATLGITQEAQDSSRRAALDRAQLEKKFEDLMTGATLVGRFSIDGKEGQNHNPEEYHIVKVSKLQGDLWMFNAKMKYGGEEKSFAFPLPVHWANDTPVISLTKLTIPGLGTFSARVVIDETRYAGTWQHDNVGGHMWGAIKRPAPAQP